MNSAAEFGADVHNVAEQSSEGKRFVSDYGVDDGQPEMARMMMGDRLELAQVGDGFECLTIRS